MAKLPCDSFVWVTASGIDVPSSHMDFQSHITPELGKGWYFLFYVVTGPVETVGMPVFLFVNLESGVLVGLGT